MSMGRFWAPALLGLLALAPGAARAQATLPFAIEVGPAFTIDGLNGIQSYACGSAKVGDGVKWLIVTGMCQGIHGFSANKADQPNNFPSKSGNPDLIVVDPAARKVWKYPLSKLSLGDSFNVAALSASNCAATQVGDILYVVGGYGTDKGARAPGDMVTFSTLTAINLPVAIQAIINGQAPDQALQQLTDPYFQVAGGGLAALNGQFHLVFGQIFNGLYSPVNMSAELPFQQQYLSRDFVFTVNTQPNLAYQSVANVSLANADGSSTVRRDFTLAPALFPGATPAPVIGIYGGVFRAQGFGAYTNPIYISGLSKPAGCPPEPGITPGEDTSFEQLLSQYDCAALPLYDATGQDMYTIFFGGISANSVDPANGALKRDPVKLANRGKKIIQDGVPYIQTISATRRMANGASAGYILPPTMQGYLGAGARLWVDPTLPLSQNGVVLLEKLSCPTVVGYIFGGIQASGPYSTQSTQVPPTVASNQFIPVRVVPGNAQARPMPPAPTPVDVIIVD